MSIWDFLFIDLRKDLAATSFCVVYLVFVNQLGHNYRLVIIAMIRLVCTICLIALFSHLKYILNILKHKAGHSPNKIKNKFT